MTVTRSKVKNALSGSVVVIFGSLLFAAAMNMFLLPSYTVLGGMTGISTVLNIFFGTPVGLTIIILNIPLIIANTAIFGIGFLKRTLIGLFCTSAAVDVFTFFPIPELDPLICAILGGTAMGAGTGILLSHGYTTGGTDLIACLIKLKWRSASTGTLIMVSDVAIIVGAALFTRSFSGLFYSLICTWAAGKVLDMMLSGSRRAGQAFIISERTNEITSLIFDRLDRGVTVLEAYGGYTGERRQVVMCVVSRREIFALKQLISECDASAFVIIADASEVSGEGFASRAAGDSTKP